MWGGKVREILADGRDAGWEGVGDSGGWVECGEVREVLAGGWDVGK